MAIKALTLGTVRPYELKRDPDRGTDRATSFKIGAIDSVIAGVIVDSALEVVVDQNRPDDTVNTRINNSVKNFKACQYGLRGWDNLQDSKGNDIPFKTVKRRHASNSYDVVDPEVLCLIAHADLAELAGEIMKDNEVGLEEGNA